VPNIPNTSQPGLTLQSRGTGQNDSQWVEGAGTFNITKTYSIVGPITNYTFPRFTMVVPSNQSVELVSVICVLSAGTVGVEILQNGSGVAGLTTISVSGTSTGRVAPTSVTPVSDLDYFQIVTTSTSGTGDLTVDFEFQIVP
jgi:hypothetical protein